MSVPPAFEAMIHDIRMDLEWPLHDPATAKEGAQIWRDLPYAVIPGFRPLMLDITVPAGQGPFPLVIFIHGGAWMNGHPTISSITYRKLDLFNRLKEAGFAVARITYRLSSEAKFPAQLYDARAALRYLRQNAQIFGVDGTRFAVMGDSAGGHVACLVGFTGNQQSLPGEENPDQISSSVAAIVNWFAPVNFLTMAEQMIDKDWPSTNDPNSPESRLIGGAVQENKELAMAASPVSYIHPEIPPVLIQHGDLDRLVPFAQAEELAGKLRSVGVSCQLFCINGADHCFWGVDGKPVVDALAFLTKTIGKGSRPR